MESDIFCKIINKEVESSPVYEDDDFIVINDKFPQAPVHVLIIPKKHVDGIHNLSEEKGGVLEKMLLVAAKVVKIVGIEQSGYRLIVNQGPDSEGGVPHLHMHVLGGKKLGAKIVQ